MTVICNCNPAVSVVYRPGLYPPAVSVVYRFIIIVISIRFHLHQFDSPIPPNSIPAFSYAELNPGEHGENSTDSVAPRQIFFHFIPTNAVTH